MSDFLTRTSEAALGVRRVVQPLIASRYAPGPRQPSLEMETVFARSPAVGLASDAESNELTDRSHGVALSDPDNVHERTPESQARAEDRIAQPETSVMETEYSAQSTTELNEVSISTPSQDRVPPDAKVSTRPTAVIVPEATGEPASHRTTSAVAPLSVRSMSVEAPETQSATPSAKAAGKSEVNERSASRSLSPADRPDLHDFAAERVSALVERKLDVREIVREGDPARRPFNQLNEDAIVTTNGNEVGRTDPDSYLNQSLLGVRDERSSPENSARRSVATRHVSESATISDRGPGDTPEPPIIRVTIGRIEVRAETRPSPPVEAPPPAAPKLSLDQFLRQHNRRSR